MYEATSNLKGGFDVPVNTPKRDEGCTQSAGNAAIDLFSTADSALWGLSDWENQHLHCAQK